MGELEYGYLPVGWLLNQRFDSLQKMPGLKVPVLLIHGTWDQRVPVEMTKQLYAVAPQPKALTLIAGGEHGKQQHGRADRIPPGGVRVLSVNTHINLTYARMSFMEQI